MISNPKTRQTILIILLWVISTMTLASFAVGGVGKRGGVLENAAYEFAAFPFTAKEVYAELSALASGAYKDAQFYVEQDAETDLTSFDPIRTAPGIELEGLLIRADHERLTPGWRLIAGAFKLNGEIENAALLLSPDLEVVKVQLLEEYGVDEFKPRSKHRKFVHGVARLDDGSLIYTFDGSVSLQRIDACGRSVWSTPGSFYRAVTLDDAQKTVWTLLGDGIAQVDAETGAILRAITTDEMIEANPSVEILELRRLHDNSINANDRNTAGEWLPQKHHLNDVDPLPAAYSGAYPQFTPGDLLLSARSLNLVFILDPDTLKIKWWRIGATQRQHDPDWGPDGDIMIFNNRMSRDYSEIVTLDPGSMAVRTAFDGRENGFYTRIRGKQQRLPGGAIAITSPQQGRVFETGPEGDVVFEAVNLDADDPARRYVISELQWMAPDAVSDLGDEQCAL